MRKFRLPASALLFFAALSLVPASDAAGQSNVGGSSGGSGGGGSVTQGTSPWVISGNGTANGSGNPIFTQVTNLPASQPVTNAGTFAVQNTAPVVGGNATAVKTDSSATTQPISATALPLPAGAATSANQDSQNFSLATIANNTTGAAIRSSTFADAANVGIASNGAVAGTPRDTGGTTSAFAKYNAVYASTQTGTYFVLASNDNFATQVIVATGAIAANVPTIVTVPVMFRYYRASISNGTSAATASISSSFTAN